MAIPEKNSIPVLLFFVFFKSPFLMELTKKKRPMESNMAKR